MSATPGSEGVLTCDVCIVGSGAGGGMLAEGLVERGLRVVMLEAGGHFTKKDFDLQEGHAIPKLYQDRGGRATADLAITVLQGRAVGGGTTVNWTTCFRTPERILTHWQRAHGLPDLQLGPHFDAVETRLSIAEWPEDRANANNRKLLEGCRKLGWEARALRRNVKGCANSGYCGLGCPVDGKQSQLVTTIPAAVARGMQLLSDCEVQRLEVRDGRVQAVHAKRAGQAVVVQAKVTVLSAGALGSPAILLRSGLNDNGRVGKRTFLHPVVAMVGRYADTIAPYYGAPQSVGSHQFIDRGSDKVGFFFETAPLQPMLAASAFHLFGRTHHAFMRELPNVAGFLALHVDGLLAGDEGGTVRLHDDGRIQLDYPVGPHLQEAFRASMRALAQVHLAAGAEVVHSLHAEAVAIRTKNDLAKLDAVSYGALEHAIFSAHQMGGCVMGPRPEASVVDADLRHHQLKNLFVVDGSVLPTSLGVNPSETVYALAHRARAVVARSA
jgi:choline dehydrogenase-like flavoprotein